MKITFKRAAALAVAILFVLGAAIIPAAAETRTYMGLKYSIYGGEITVEGYTGSDPDLIIPDEIGGVPVTAIGDVAFGNCESIVSVTIGRNVTLIGEFAFGHCVSLRTVYYVGSEAEWYDNVAVEDGNDRLLAAEFVFNYSTGLFVFVPAKAPTCTEDGNTRYYVSRMNGKYYSDGEGVREIGEDSVIVPALGHDYRAVGSGTSADEEPLVTYVCSRCGDSKVDVAGAGSKHTFGQWRVTVAPKCTDKGEMARVCSDCGLIDKEDIPALGHNFGSDGNAEFCQRCGAANPEYVPPLPFEDVPADAYYADAIRWAVRRGVTEGTAANRFSPDNGCTRAQVVTFLWRAAGCPKPKMGVNPFSDVKDEAYFADAVLWAVENGITVGTGPTKFSPDGACTRAQIVTLIHRASGCPSPKMGMIPFSDVSSNDYFSAAVLWAVENGITLGTGDGRFSPGATCTRAQIVSFLYRGMTDEAER